MSEKGSITINTEKLAFLGEKLFLLICNMQYAYLGTNGVQGGARGCKGAQGDIRGCKGM